MKIYIGFVIPFRYTKKRLTKIPTIIIHLKYIELCSPKITTVDIISFIWIGTQDQDNLFLHYRQLLESILIIHAIFNSCTVHLYFYNLVTLFRIFLKEGLVYILNFFVKQPNFDHQISYGCFGSVVFHSYPFLTYCTFFAIELHWK